MQHLINEMGIPTLWHKPILLAVWFTVVWFIAYIIRIQITKSSLDNDVCYKVKKAVTFSTYVFFLIGVVVMYSSNPGGFTVALGVAGAGIAFQVVIASFAGWLANPVVNETKSYSEEVASTCKEMTRKYREENATCCTEN